MLFQQTVKNFIQGVSQQPAQITTPEQLKEQINGYSTESTGLQKRPPTCLKKYLFKRDNDKSIFTHFINRDNTEKYIVSLVNDTIEVYDLNGNTYQVDIDDKVKPYLVSNNPRKDFVMFTVNDTTFILNKTVVTKMSDKVSAINNYLNNYYTMWINAPQYGRAFYVSVGAHGGVAQYTFPASGDGSVVRTDVGMTSFAQNANNTGIMPCVWVYGSTAVLRNNEPQSTVLGHTENMGIFFKDTVTDVSKLPPSFPDSYILKVAPKNNNNYYYMRRVGQMWIESTCGGLKDEIDATTMPIKLVRQADGTFKVSLIDWDKRMVGDETINPMPSFIGKTINDIFFFKNRLGFLSGENMILSENDNYFNFWFTTMMDTPDTDPIDVSNSSNRVNKLLYAVPWDEQLYLFSDNTQFVVTDNGVLSPKNTGVMEVTSYKSSPDCRPVTIGSNIYFSKLSQDNSSIYEYYNVQQVSDVKSAQNISSHIPTYLNGNIWKIVGDTMHNIIFCLSEKNPDTIFIYKFLFLDGNRVQSSWSKWQFSSNIVDMTIIESKLYIILECNNRYHLSTLELSLDVTDLPEETHYRLYLDRKHVVTRFSIDSTMDTTTIDVGVEFDYELEHLNFEKIQLITSDTHLYEITKDELIASGGFWVLPLAVQDTMIIGIVYEMKVSLHTLYIKEAQQTSYLTKLNGRTQLRDLKIKYQDSGSYDVVVNPNAHSYTSTPRLLGTTSSTLGLDPFNSGVFRVPIQQLNTITDIDIINNNPLNISLLGYDWECTFVQKSREI